MYKVVVVSGRAGRFWTGVFLCSALLFVMMQLSAFAAGTVTLAWDPSTDSSVAGYNIHYGGASGTYTYTSKVPGVNSTNVTIPGLVQGTTYYFAATTYSVAGLESSLSGEVSYWVPPVTTNHPPTLNAITNLVINENAGLQIVSLFGITSGATNESQTLAVTAVSSNTTLIPNPTVTYTNGYTTGKLTFTPVANAVGITTISVTVNDGGTNNNIVIRNFTVTVNSTNLSPTLDPIPNMIVNAGAPSQRIALTGISSGTTNNSLRLRVTVACSNQRLVSRPTVRYVSPATSGALTFCPGSLTGTATVSVTVNNGARSNNVITRSFTVTIVPRGASTNLVASISGTTGTTNITAATLTAAAQVGGQFALTVAGAAGHQYVVEASTDLVNWVPVQTNTAPFTFVDTAAGQFNQRFYRSVYIH
jgi:hypothetical protein